MTEERQTSAFGNGMIWFGTGLSIAEILTGTYFGALILVWILIGLKNLGRVNTVAMPLSWVPLISDYTQEAKSPVTASAFSAVVYGMVSCWMYLIGMGLAILTGESDIAMIMVKSGVGQ